MTGAAQVACKLVPAFLLLAAVACTVWQATVIRDTTSIKFVGVVVALNAELGVLAGYLICAFNICPPLEPEQAFTIQATPRVPDPRSTVLAPQLVSPGPQE